MVGGWEGGRRFRQLLIWGEVLVDGACAALFIIILVAESVCVDVAVEELR